ncbi:hypothetical protein [uncultured Methylobacterium sp.]|uniref:hypothetical protein n=1 Tax=uncultured Methylobacterium sp. TaxID=157278 RepID=UPI0035CC9139
MANALAPLVSRMTTEQVRHALGDSLGNLGQLCRDLSDIKSRCPDRLKRIGFERLFWMCDCLSVNPIQAMSASTALNLMAVH